jgi:hypothetical protein
VTYEYRELPLEIGVVQAVTWLGQRGEGRRTMSIASPEAESLTMKQRVFIGALGVLSVLLAALVVFYFSPAEETSKALPARNLSPAMYGNNILT